MALTKLTTIEGDMALVRLDQVACAYPSEMFGEGKASGFDVETISCTKISMINGDILHVSETPENILALSQEI